MTAPTTPAWDASPAPPEPGAPLDVVAQGLRRAQAVLARRYDSNRSLIWLAGRHALAVRSSDPVVFPVGPISIHLRYPHWIEPDLFTYWFDGLETDVAWGRRGVRAGRSLETRRGDEWQFALRLLHALSVDDRAWSPTGEQIPALEPARVVIAELWKASLARGHADVSLEAGMDTSGLACGAAIEAALQVPTTAGALVELVASATTAVLPVRRDDNGVAALLARVVDHTLAWIRANRAATDGNPVDCVLDQALDWVRAAFVGTAAPEMA